MQANICGDFFSLIKLFWSVCRTKQTILTKKGAKI